MVGSHHLARGMARRGHQVAHLSPPVTPAHLLKLPEPFERERFARWQRGSDSVDSFIDLVPAEREQVMIAMRTDPTSTTRSGRRRGPRGGGAPCGWCPHWEC